MAEKLSKDAIRKELDELKTQMESFKKQDPFWFFEPSDGVIDDERRNILLKHIKPEDIPIKLDSQLDTLLSDVSYLGVCGGNQAGKTLVATIKSLIKSTGLIPLSLEPYKDKFTKVIERTTSKVILGRVVGVDFKQLHRVVIPSWQKWTPRQCLKNGKWEESFSAQFETLTLYRGKNICAVVQFMTNQMDVSSFQGDPLDWCTYDEEPTEAIHKENKMRFVTSDRMDFTFAWTPTNGLTWATDLFQYGIFDGKQETSKIQLFKLCTVTNPVANPEVVDEIASDTDSYEVLKMRLLGEFVSLSGLVYGGLFNEKIHIKEPFYENLSEFQKHDYLTLYGADPHTVTPTAMVFVLVDRENNCYVDRCITGSWDTDEIKFNFWKTVYASKYRLGWGAVDRSSNSDNIAFGGRNIFKELTRPTYRQGHKSPIVAGYDPDPQTMIKALPSLRESEKFEGSIKAGVDEIKRRLREPARFFVINRPENKELIHAFRTMERDTYKNEDTKGLKDRIKEGRHHMHASLRYVFQFPINWYPAQIQVPEYQYQDEGVFL